jgi:anti-sigma regulatory factor (Ser/Thr protein kinase)
VTGRTLEVEANLGAVRAAAVWLHSVAEDDDLPADVSFGLDVAVHEAVENAVRHGCRDRAGHLIRLSRRNDGRRVEVVVEDDGIPFDPSSLPAPPAPQRIGDVVPGGQGVSLIRHFTDEVRYRREGDWNVLTLVRGLAPRTEGA